MKKNVVILILSVMSLLQTACLLVGGEADADLKAIIEKKGDQAEKYFLSGDVEAMLQYYCDDVISMPNNHPMVRGRADLKRKTEAILSMGLKFESIESATVEVQSSGELVYEIGTFRQSVLIPGTQEPLEQKGKYVNIWKRQPDASLKIAVEIYNSDENPGAKQID